MLTAALEGPVSAYRLLHDPKVAGDLTMGQVLELCQRAGYSREASERAAAEQGRARMDRGLPA